MSPFAPCLRYICGCGRRTSGPVHRFSSVLISTTLGTVFSPGGGNIPGVINLKGTVFDLRMTQHLSPQPPTPVSTDSLTFSYL